MEMDWNFMADKFLGRLKCFKLSFLYLFCTLNSENYDCHIVGTLIGRSGVLET